MDPSYVDSDEEAVAMAKAMGFSTFGAQGPAKKRKYNPKTDAMVEGQDLDAIDRGGNKGQGSGGNQIPLGRLRVFGLSTTGNPDEIALDNMGDDDDDDDDDDEDPEPAYLDTSLPAPLEKEAEEEHSRTVYLDTSLPSPNREDRATQERIDAILAKTDITSSSPGFRPTSKSHTPALGQGVSRYLTELQNVSQQPPPRLAASIEARQPTGDSHRSAQRGHRNELWYIGYYDPSFNENPWAKLEKERGLHSKGRWLKSIGRAV